MDKKYVQQYNELENKHWWFIIRQKIILQTILKFIPAKEIGRLKILNVGAASGGSSKWLSQLGEVISLENDPLFLTHLANQKLNVINASVIGIPIADDSFDLVCAFDVIEHVEQDQKAVDELIRVCKPGGSICITVPAFQSLWGIHDEVNGHKRRYVKNQFTKLVDHHAIRMLYISYFNTILFIPIFLFRKIQNISKESHLQDSDFKYFKSNIMINGLLKFLFGMELFFLRWIKFSFGVSLIFLIRKHGFNNKGPQ